MCCALNRLDTHNCPHLLFEPAKSRSFLLAVVNLALGMPLAVPFSNASDKGILLFLGFNVHGTLRNNLQTAILACVYVYGSRKNVTEIRE